MEPQPVQIILLPFPPTTSAQAQNNIHLASTGRASKRLQEHKFKPLASRQRDLQTISFKKGPCKAKEQCIILPECLQGYGGKQELFVSIDLMEEGLIFRDQVGTLEVHVPFLVEQHCLRREFTFSSSCTEFSLL